jgi:hypothetical protein
LRAVSGALGVESVAQYLVCILIFKRKVVGTIFTSENFLIGQRSVFTTTENQQ